MKAAPQRPRPITYVARDAFSLADIFPFITAVFLSDRIDWNAHRTPGARIRNADRAGSALLGEIGWSGRRESNPRMQLGKLPFYH